MRAHRQAAPGRAKTSFAPTRSSWQCPHAVGSGLVGWEGSITTSLPPQNRTCHFRVIRLKQATGPKDTLSQVTDLPVGFRPVGRSLGSVCMVYTRHLTCPSISNRYSALWVAHQVHVSTLSGWVSPIQPVMSSRCLSAAGLRFLDLPTPTEEFATLTIGLLGFIPDLIGVIMFRSLEMRLVRMPFLLRGLGVRECGIVIRIP